MPKYSAAWRMFMTSGESFVFPIRLLPNQRTALCARCPFASLTLGGCSDFMARSLPTIAFDTAAVLPSWAGHGSFMGREKVVNDFLSGSRAQVKVNLRRSEEHTSELQ